MTPAKWIASLSSAVVLGYVLIRLLGAEIASLAMILLGTAGMWWDHKVRKSEAK
jgi:hypothetical protein